MNKKQKKVWKIVVIIVIAWVAIGIGNLAVHKKVITSSNSHANEWNPDENQPQLAEPGGSGGGGDYNPFGDSSWQFVWMGPLCWSDMSACW